MTELAAASTANQIMPELSYSATSQSGIQPAAKSFGSGDEVKTTFGSGWGAISARLPIIVPWSIAAVLVVMLFYRSNVPPIAAPIAKVQADHFFGLLVDEAGAQFEDGFGPDNVKFGSGEYRLAKGAIHLRLDNGADVLMKSPTAFRIDHSFHVVLHDGSFRAIVPPSAQGFTVATPGIDYEDLGTEFGVTVDRRSGKSKMHVFDGQVDARDPASNKVITSITQGQSVGFSDGVLRPEAAPEDGSFLSPGSIGFLRWQTHCEKLRQDPDLIGFYPFIEADTLENHAINAITSDGQINGARWTSSRWPGKSALLFDRDSDFVGLTIPGEYREITIAFWVNVDRLDYEYSAILNSNFFDPGDFQVQIDRNGLLGTNVKGDSHSRRIVAGNSLESGKWQHVVVVVSAAGGKHRTYVNGELSVKADWNFDIPVTPGECRLGNWLAIPNWHHVPKRALKGRMDEVAIWKRALTPGEIKAQYEAGRPSLLEG